MARYRKRAKPLWITLPLWGAGIATIGWGLWQFAEFRHTLVAQAQQPAAPESSIFADAAPPYAGQKFTSTGTDAGATDAPITNLTPPPPPPFAQAVAPAHVGPPPDAEALFAKGQQLLEAGRIVEARSALNAALAYLPDSPRTDRLREQLAALNIPVFLGSAILPDDPAVRYVDIQQGDSFLKLGHQYKVPAAFLEEINPNLDPRNLRITAGVKVVRGPFTLHLIKHAGRLDLFARDLYVRSFSAQLEDGNFLPRGAYRIKPASKIDLGSRKWIGFEGVEPATRDVSVGWLYGSAGMRGGSQNASADDRLTGVKFEDEDLLQLYTVLVETHSTLRVLP